MNFITMVINNMIPFLDLKAQYQNIRNEVRAAVDAVLESGQFVLGKEVESFEAEFAGYCQAQYGVGVNSGTSALHLALLAAGIGPGDEIITVPFTFVATVAAILYCGARPVFIDIDSHSYTMDVRQIENAIGERTKAILPVHLYGQPADMDPILALARRHDLVVIEDAAQAHGATYKTRPVGGIGDLGCFSFYPGKNLGAYGEGGMVLTHNPEYVHRMKMLRDWGADKKYNHVLKGYNYRMEALQGAILRVKLRHLDAWTKNRREHASWYQLHLKDCGVILPQEMSYARHVYHVYAIRTKSRDLVQQRLLERNVQTNIHYPTPVHLLPAYADLGYPPGSFPVAEQVAREELSLPMYAELSSQSLESIESTLRTVVRDTP